jgi:hypothetical protein
MGVAGHLWDKVKSKVRTQKAKLFDEKSARFLELQVTQVKALIPGKQYVIMADERIAGILSGRAFAMDPTSRIKLNKEIKDESTTTVSNIRKTSKIHPVDSQEEAGVVYTTMGEHVRELMTFTPEMQIVADFLGDLGTNVLPFIQTIKGAIGASIQAVSLAMTQYKLLKIDMLLEGMDSEVARLSIVAMTEIFKQKRQKHLVKLGTYSIDIVGGMVDPSRATAIVASGARLTYAIIQFSLYRKTAKEVNDKLKSSTGYLLNKSWWTESR